MSSPRAFSAMTLERASRLLHGPTMARLRTLGTTALTAVGDWHGRRFVIGAFVPAPSSPAKPGSDTEGFTLTFSLSIAPDDFVRECRSFGARVERQQRDRNRRFESVGDSAGVIHTVHSHHHVALCGAKGPWPLEPTLKAPCTACGAAAEMAPKHRARYHPSG